MDVCSSVFTLDLQGDTDVFPDFLGNTDVDTMWSKSQEILNSIV